MLFPTNSLPTGPPIETKKAMLLLDFQNDFVSPNGRLPVSNVQSFLPNLTCLVAEFRAKGEVIWVGTEYEQSRTIVSPSTGQRAILLKQFLQEQNPAKETSESPDDHGNIGPKFEDPESPSTEPDFTHDREAFLAPLLTVNRYRCCMPGSEGTEYPDIIKATIDPKRDLVLLKTHYSAFVDTPLLMHLRTRLVTELYVCGSLSNVTVYATVLDAVCHGLKVTVIEDCLGYNDDLCHLEAMRQMADSMGADGVDCQELRDDLAGLLGDVIREEDFPLKFQVSLPPPSRRTKSHTSRQHIHDWISKLDGEQSSPPLSRNKGPLPKQTAASLTDGQDSKTKNESPRRSARPITPESTPPRKRSASDRDSLEEDPPQLPHQPSSHRPPNTGRGAGQSHQGHAAPLNRKRRSSRESSLRSHTSTPHTAMARTRSTEASASRNAAVSPSERTHDVSGPSPTNREGQGGEAKQKKKKNKTSPPSLLEPGDKMGQGDCRLCTDVISPTEADRAFHHCKESIKWQKMFHRSGEVPRLVAVQGCILENGAKIPIYRHPADESPELQPFDSVVDMLRKAAESVVGHPLNHALIQYYRNGEDNISEHSDKTLDIVRGSSVVNLSLGAQRTMVLRMKKSAAAGHTSADDGAEGGTASRPSQRIALPHNSVFVLGEETNRHWLHAIRADKRLAAEKDPAELAFDEERISMTFRHIGTFIDPHSNTIWGQGATNKEKEGAKKVLTGTEVERQGEAMIRAFGQENHLGSDWNWDEWYGKGFDVVNFETKEIQEDQTGRA